MAKNLQKRLDVFLAKAGKGFSRNLWQKFIKTEGVQVNGCLIKKPHYLLGPQDCVDVPEKAMGLFLKSLKPEKTVDADMNNLIIKNYKHFFVINKPPFITTEVLTKGYFPVHRLDKNTSGILVVAKDLKTQAALQRQWQERKVKKTYIALVKGILKPGKGAIEASIFRSSKDRKKMALSSLPRARHAYTEYKVVRYFQNPDFSLVKVFPLTGRTHQIRVHFAGIGHPVIGDDIYGDKKLNKKVERLFGLKRQFLHAYKLSLVNPATKKRTEFTCELPEDLERVKLEK